MAERFAAVGDVHGRMTTMVTELRAWEEASGLGLDFVLQVGDFEPHRHEDDLASMAAPGRHRRLGDFPAYWRGEERIPWPLTFIGGNHEPYAFLDRHDGEELMAGLRYLGRAGRVELGGLEIVGLSGIYVDELYSEQRPGPDERVGVSNKDLVGFTEDELASLLDGGADILLLHDWPEGMIPEERVQEFWGERRGQDPGNAPARLLVEILKPKLVLCGHLHRRDAFSIPLDGGATAEVICLGKVGQGPDAFAVFEIEDGRPRLIT